jgi:hypothetical protein
LVDCSAKRCSSGFAPSVAIRRALNELQPISDAVTSGRFAAGGEAAGVHDPKFATTICVVTLISSAPMRQLASAPVLPDV